MPRLICHMLGKHRPAVVVTGFREGRPVPEQVCPHCGGRRHNVV